MSQAIKMVIMSVATFNDLRRTSAQGHSPKTGRILGWSRVRGGSLAPAPKRVLAEREGATLSSNQLKGLDYFD